MKILLINHFPLSGSGSGVYTKNVAKSLQAKGHEVCVIMPENTKKYEVLDDIKMHPVFFTDKEKIENALPFNFPCFTTHPRSTTSFYELSDLEIKQYDNAFEKAIKEEVETFKPDIIHAQHIWILADIASRFNIPLVITAHGTDLMGYNKDSRFHKYCNNSVKKCKNIITISKDSNDLVEKTYPTATKKAVLIKNGFDTNIFYPQNYNKEKILNELGINENYNKVVSFVGKLTNFKGVDILLKAVKLYEKNDILTLIAGDGELFKSLNELSKELELKNVKFLGNKSHEELRKIYNIADVSIVPSRR